MASAVLHHHEALGNEQADYTMLNPSRRSCQTTCETDSHLYDVISGWHVVAPCSRHCHCAGSTSSDMAS
jgi:hypothetical protein